jgi:2-C-methyl-D-erythritol 4-phosphate cytidylyltransferase
LITAIIVAGGNGTRMNNKLPKQFIKIGTESIIEKTIKIFNTYKDINEIIVVLNDNHKQYFKKENINHDKLIKVISGGETRQQSVYNGLKNVSKKCEIVLIHDAVRPFVSHKNIKDCIDEVKKNKACTLGVKSKDTIKICDKDNIISDTPNREFVFCIQTPQAFTLKVILLAHKKALEENFLGTDDCSLLERLGISVKVVEGSYKNIKITTEEDLAIAKEFLSS